MRRLAILLCSVTAACSAPEANTDSSGKLVACPQEVLYTKDQQRMAAEELAMLPPEGMVRGHFMPDYGRLRDQSRACRGEGIPKPS